MAKENTKGKEEFEKYLNKLDDFESEIAYLFSIMKKDNYNFEKHTSKIYDKEICSLYFSDVIDEMLIDKKVSDKDKQLLRVMSEYKYSIDNEHISTNVDIKALYDVIDEEIIGKCLKDFLDDYMKIYFKNFNDFSQNFEKCANILLKKNDQVKYKTLVFTDSYNLAMYIINNQIEADIVFKEFDINVRDSKIITQLQILVNILGLDDKIEIFKGDVLKNTYDKKYEFDLVTIYYQASYKFPPRLIQRKIENGRLRSLNKKTSISNEYFYISEAYNYLKHNGIITCVISDLALYKIADDEIKREMVNKKMIKSIVTIPTAANSNRKDQNIITLQDGSSKIEFCFCNKIEELIKTPMYSKKINIEDLTNYDLRPSRILFENKSDAKNTKELSYFLVDCFRGCQISNLDFNENGKFELLKVSDIDDGVIGDNLEKFNYEKKNMEKFFRFLLKENDIVISTHGTRMKIAIAENIENRRIIPNTNFIVLRPNPKKINPYYLEAYLSSETGMKALKDISTGTSSIIINDANMKQLLISVKDLKEQNEIEKTIKKQRQEIAFLKKQLKDVLEERNNFIEKQFVEIENSKDNAVFTDKTIIKKGE